MHSSTATGALTVAAVVAVPLALILLVLAIDVLRTPGWVAEDDSRFQSAPIRGSGLWNEAGMLATRARNTTLGLDDDFAYRRVVALFSQLQPGNEDQLIDPELENRWAQLQFELTAQSRENAPDAGGAQGEQSGQGRSGSGY